MSIEQENEWIEWNGGECPVAGDTVVQVRFRGRPNENRVSSTTSGRADFWKIGTDWWRHASPRRDNDIIAYRIARES